MLTASPGGAAAFRVLVHHPQCGELGAPGHVEEAEPYAGVCASREPELGHRLVQERLEVGVSVEPVEELESEAVLGDIRRVGDRERLLAGGRLQLREPLVGAADRVEREDVVKEALPRGPDRLARLARRERRRGRAVPGEEVWTRVDVGDDVAETRPVDLYRGRLAGEAHLAGSWVELGERGDAAAAQAVKPPGRTRPSPRARR